MSGVNGLSGALSRSYEKLSSAKRINKAADDAAGLKIAEKTKSQINGYDVGVNNLSTGKNLVNTADSALGSMNDSLQRLRELAVAAQNTAIYGDDDIKAMQDETDALLSGMNGVVDTAQFNGKRLLDDNELQIAGNGNPDSKTIKTVNSSVDSLGLSGLNIASNDALKKIDEAIATINDTRSGLGATSNALDYQIDYNKEASVLSNASLSTIEDLDYPKEVSEMKKNEVLNEYSTQMQKNQMQQKMNETQRLLGL
ncbi:MAG: flagellin FliC5 [Lachnospiraceae bacterium]|nr:flagellin FliC5 [Lachnospiraceae bacterium]MBO4462152.1 flagellin FliC5 [Lachnospiraceae bacterium]MBR4795168.1 flagellin FliC5 [Lachnospiraceae bacterium]MBR5789747.1 flagellin FliC5 [Lachnospiraceae bacterium]